MSKATDSDTLTLFARGFCLAPNARLRTVMVGKAALHLGRLDPCAKVRAWGRALNAAGATRSQLDQGMDALVPA